MTGPVGTHTRPGQVVILGFAAIIATGTLLLRLPIAHEPDAPGVSLFDAFFAAVSATTVTGLAVDDTGSTFSVFGELVLMALIQAGGLGLMTLASIASILVSKRLGIRRGLLAGAEIGLDNLGDLRRVIRAIVTFTVCSESAIAVVLTTRFAIAGDHSFLGSIHLGVFHSVSAFNNAGFALFGGGLERFVGDPVVNLAIAAAIIAGGLGFPVVVEIANDWRRPRQWSLHTKVTVSATGLLIVVGTAAIALIEWTNPDTIGDLGVGSKLLASFFQSVTTRTAGFNTVDIGALRGGSLLLMLLFMAIGASSASTGGGIKTSTIAVVVWTTIAEFRGDREVNLFHRRLPSSLQRHALALVVAALGTIGTATFALSLADPHLALEDLLFEATSAFGTVGLSTGITASLDPIGRCLIMVLMFIGRVGPVAFGTALLFRDAPTQYRYPEEKLLVG